MSSEQHKEKEKSPRLSQRAKLFSILIYLGGTATGILVENARQNTLANADLPQGHWQTVSVTGNTLHAEVNAYPQYPDEGIERVNVTIQDKDGNWRSLCLLLQAQKSNTFVCDKDISSYVDPGQTTQISFDVVSTKGKVSYAPNGLKTITLPQK